MISVLRLNHRIGRDDRMSTHCGLVSRAFGADEIIFTGDEDHGLIESIRNVVQRWGGNFQARHESSHTKVIKDYKRRGFKVVHLTMYGMPIQEKIDEIKKSNNLLIVIGGEKVPPEVYQLADFNISVTTQPHSEVAALSITLDRIFGGKELSKEFNGEMKVVPQEKGKKVIRWKKETSHSTEHIQN